MFRIGDMVVYNGEGPCKVAGVGPLDMDAVDKDCLYYTLEPIYHTGKIFIPVDTKVFMRPVISQDKAEQLIGQIPEISEKDMAGESLQEMKAQYNALVQSNDCKDLIQLIKTVYSKRKSIRKEGKKLGQLDERYMKRAEDMLHGELAVALRIDKDAVQEYISKRVQEIEMRQPAVV